MAYKKKISLLILTLFIVFSSTFAKDMDEISYEAIDSDHTTGIYVLVSQRGSIIYERAFGTSAAKNKDFITKDYLFDLASLTKVYATTFAVMRLVDDGAINIDDPIYYYFPEFRNSTKKAITIRHLLTHTSGMPQWVPVYFHAANKNEAKKYVLNLPLKFEIGERKYSDLGFMILGYLVEEVTGQPLDEFVTETLYKHLGLKNTVFNPIQKHFKKICATSVGNPFEKNMIEENKFGHEIYNPEKFDRWRNDIVIGEVNDGNSYYAHGGVAGHAGLFSTAEDLLVLSEIMLNMGTYKDVRYFKEETVKKFLTSDNRGQGLGWIMHGKSIGADDAEKGVYGHLGFTGTSVVIYPQKELIVILLTNRQQKGLNKKGYYPWLGELRREVFKKALEAVK